MNFSLVYMLQLVFLVLTGEAWGYLGSRRFFEEFDQQSDAIKGLNLTAIEMVYHLNHTWDRNIKC